MEDYREDLEDSYHPARCQTGFRTELEGIELVYRDDDASSPTGFYYELRDEIPGPDEVRVLTKHARISPELCAVGSGCEGWGFSRLLETVRKRDYLTQPEDWNGEESILPEGGLRSELEELADIFLG